MNNFHQNGKPDATDSSQNQQYASLVEQLDLMIRARYPLVNDRLPSIKNSDRTSLTHPTRSAIALENSPSAIKIGIIAVYVIQVIQIMLSVRLDPETEQQLADILSHE